MGISSVTWKWKSSILPPEKVSILNAEGKRKILDISIAAVYSGLITIARLNSDFKNSISWE